ncbi:MAG: Verru_Chthon cassette protein A [Verrucomicrobiales bacterium]
MGEPEYPEFPDRLGVPASAEELSLVTFTEVEIQLRRGTTGFLANEQTSWASQPGAIRMFGNRVDEIFKLYSAEEMHVSGSSDLSADVPADWDAQPDRYVDLNVPSVDPGGGLVFPIADPRAFSGGPDGAEGFSYTPSINGVVPPDALGGSHDGQRLPMPVQWRYVLRDGKVGTLGGENRWEGNGSASESNPIVGRIAYWTDDLSNRINVNTASEGAYWDTPRADTLEERSYAENQPARNEFQRQPGHPAMVCLSSVLFPNRRYYLPGTEGALDPLSLADAEQLWRIAPGIGLGGSRGGTVRIAEDQPPVAPEPADYELYASPGDLLASNPTLPVDVAQRVRRGDFLLTAASNAPETTLLGLPRIAMWPVPGLEPQRAAFDQQLAELTTLQDSSYHFLRPGRATGVELHRELYTTGASNNAKLFELLRQMANSRMPGYSDTSFGRKYSTSTFGDWAQLSVAIHGYVRGANLSDPTAPEAVTPGPEEIGHGQLAPLCRCGGTSTHQSVWWQNLSPYPLGGGRAQSISEVALVFAVSGHVDEGGTAYGDSEGLSLGERRFEVALVLEVFCPGHGITQIRPKSHLTAVLDTAGGDFDVAPIPLHLDGQQYRSTLIDSTAIGSAGDGGSGGVQQFTGNGSGQPLVWSRQSDPTRSFKVTGDQLRLEQLGHASAGFILLVQSSVGGLNEFWNVLSVRPPAGLFPVQIPAPQIPADPSQIGTWSERLAAASDDPQALIREGDVVRSFVPRHGDTRLLHSRRVPLVSGRSGSWHHFTSHPDFANPADPMSHSLVGPDGQPLYGFSAGRPLVDGAAYAPTVQPDFPLSPDSPDYLQFDDETLELDPSVTGDFDTGYARTPDGAYTNYPDAGVYFADGTPYFERRGGASTSNAAVFAPQRLMPGPGMLGSLPSGGTSGIPWRTLLFRPDPQHFGSTELPDHVLLDSFWMPVPEPHGISHDHATDGKINMNYAIAPFAHIRRATALHALFKAEKLMAIPTAAAAVYKTQTSGESWRHFIDADQTLRQFESRFDGGGYFRSASEICEQYLVPEGVELGEEVGGDYPGMRAFWDEHKLTGDNVKERPYTNLHTRLTTRSNTFKIYAIVQPISNGAGSDPAVFEPGSDTLHEATPISATLRRLLDGTPDCSSFDGENRGFPDYLAGDIRFLPGLDRFYRFSIVDAEPDLQGRPEIEEVAHPPGGDLAIRWRARGPDVFTIERSTDLRRWEVIEADFGGTAPWTEFIDPDPPVGVRSYYRVSRR